MMVTFIRLYPIVAICLAYVFFDFGRNLRNKGKQFWYLPTIISLVAILTIVLWGIYRGDQNAERWAKEWASLTFLQYINIV